MVEETCDLDIPSLSERLTQADPYVVLAEFLAADHRELRAPSLEASRLSGQDAPGGLVTGACELASEPHESVCRPVMFVLGEAAQPDLAISVLVSVLIDARGTIRRNAAVGLGKLGDVRAVLPLIHALHDTNADVRQRAAEALGKLGDAAAAEPLIAFLTDESEKVRAQAAEALGKLGDRRAVEPLGFALEDGSREVRLAAATAQRELGDQRAVKSLISAVLKDRDNRVRRRAAEALGSLADQSAVLPLISVLGDSDMAVRKRAVDALRVLGDQRAVFPFIIALGDSDAGLRKQIAEALGALGDQRAEPVLTAMLTDSDACVRIGAAEALAALTERQHVIPLIPVSEDDKTRADRAQDGEPPLVQRRLAEFLNPGSEDRGKIHQPPNGEVVAESAQPLEPLYSSSIELKGSAHQTLDEPARLTQDGHGLERSLSDLEYRSPQMRADAAKNLGRLGDSQIVKWDAVQTLRRTGVIDARPVVGKLGARLRRRPRITKLYGCALLAGIVIAVVLAELLWALS